MNPSVPSSTQIGIALLHVSLGVMWITHALLKLLVFTLPVTAQYFASVGLSGFLAYPVVAAELLGGIPLLLGVYARQTALPLVPVMAMAAWVHLPNGWVHTRAGGSWEYPVFLIAASISLWLPRRRRRGHQAQHGPGYSLPCCLTGPRRIRSLNFRQELP